MGFIKLRESIYTDSEPGPQVYSLSARAFYKLQLENGKSTDPRSAAWVVLGLRAKDDPFEVVGLRLMCIWGEGADCLFPMVFKIRESLGRVLLQAC